MSKYGVFSGPYFPAFGLNTEIYSVNRKSIFRKMRTRKTPYLDTVQAVFVLSFALDIVELFLNLYLDADRSDFPAKNCDFSFRVICVCYSDNFAP